MAYPAMEISFTKLLGQIQDRGNVEIIKHYLRPIMIEIHTFFLLLLLFLQSRWTLLLMFLIILLMHA